MNTKDSVQYLNYFIDNINVKDTEDILEVLISDRIYNNIKHLLIDDMYRGYKIVSFNKRAV